MPSIVGEKDLCQKHIMVKFQNTCNKYILKSIWEDNVGHTQRIKNQSNIKFLNNNAANWKTMVVCGEWELGWGRVDCYFS